MYTSTFIEKIQETPTDWSFRFTKPVGYVYKAGQYSVLRMPMKYEDSRHGARTCSLSSSPTEEFLQFTFTLRDTGFKKTLCELVPGDEITITPARGFLTLDAVKTSAVCMIAGGIGVAPFRSIAKYMHDTQTFTPDALLIYSDKDHHEIAFANEWSEFENLSCFITLTRLDHVHEWPGLRGRMSWKMIESCGAVGPEVTYLLCGAPEMVKDIKDMLISNHVKPELIIQELFTGY